MATKEEILEGVIDAVSEAYDVDAANLSAETRFSEMTNNSSSRVLKTALFIGENLDLEDDLEFDDLASLQSIQEIVDMLAERLG